ncbi:MAG: Cytochrome b6-f complex iron-sulfur subunit [bacterium]|nr:Cytochrome b6-f complex iron-sulfur subunit [bacterium]
MKNPEVQTRREFCLNACQAASLFAISGALSALLQGCSSDDPLSSNAQNLSKIQATAVNGTVTLNIDANSPLATVGSAAQVQYGGNTLLVARTAQDTFAAVTAVCTHQGCTITGYGNQVYTCPCHGSQFDTNGQVKRGPAGSALRKYQAQFANNQLTITVS